MRNFGNVNTEQSGNCATVAPATERNGGDAQQVYLILSKRWCRRLLATSSLHGAIRSIPTERTVQKVKREHSPVCAAIYPRCLAKPTMLFAGQTNLARPSDVTAPSTMRFAGSARACIPCSSGEAKLICFASVATCKPFHCSSASAFPPANMQSSRRTASLPVRRCGRHFRLLAIRPGLSVRLPNFQVY